MTLSLNHSFKDKIHSWNHQTFVYWKTGLITCPILFCSCFYSTKASNHFQNYSVHHKLTKHRLIRNLIRWYCTTNYLLSTTMVKNKQRKIFFWLSPSFAHNPQELSPGASEDALQSAWIEVQAKAKLVLMVKKLMTSSLQRWLSCLLHLISNAQ